jgi:formylglycine-generating enzyme required for sulfatase activity
MKEQYKLILNAWNHASDGLLSPIHDADLARLTKTPPFDLRNHLESMEQEGLIERVRVENPDGFNVLITALGRLELGKLRLSQDQSGKDVVKPTAIKVVPKGLRSYEEEDAYFFLELLPGTRDRDGLPESIRYWKIPIERTDADRTFRVGLIYGPSGSGKSSLVKAGLLPNLAGHVLSAYVEAIPEGTEARLLNKLRNNCPELSIDLGLKRAVQDLSQGQVLSPGKKILIVLDQFEQWLSAWRGDEESGLFAALRHCDGGHVQAIVLVRDDFWMVVNRFEKQLGVEFRRTLNSYGIDLFDPIHAKKVLMDFGRAFGRLPDNPEDISDSQGAFLDQAMEGLVEKGKVVPVRLSLFAWMVRGKPWTTETLRNVGGAEGVGLNFLEETFNSPHAEPKYRHHQRAAQAVLKALLPEGGTRIRGEAKSYSELISASGYAHRPGDFEDLRRILDGEVRLITPTAREESSTTDQKELTKPIEQYYQLTHDYLVPSIRGWLTRKQKETWRGWFELRLAERSALWNVKPVNRYLPSVWESSGIRLLTKKKDWTELQRKMMKHAGRVHGLRGLGLAVLIALVSWGGMEGYGRLRASALVESLQRVGTPDVPAIVKQFSGYRRWADPQLVRVAQGTDAQSREHLHASLALLPVDASQVDYLFDRLLKIKDTPSEFPVLRDALQTHRTTLTPKLWTVLESANPGDDSLLPAASALASYSPDDARWEAESGKVAQALVSVNSLLLRPWIEALRPVRGKLTAPLATIFREKSRSDSVHSLATDILTDYASDDPDLLANLLMVSDPKAFLSLFPVAEKRAEQVFPVFQAELAKKATYSWNDQPLDPTWTKPDAVLVRRIELAQGILSERFAFCQTMPLDEFLTVAEALRISGFRPVRFRPYVDGQVVRVAAVWTRDGRNWRSISELSPEQIRQQDERNKKDKFLPVDIAGHMATDKDGKTADCYAALWVEKYGDDDARLYAGMTVDEETELQDKLKDEKLIPRTLHAMIGSEGRTRCCGVWGRPAGALITGQTYRDKFEGNFQQKQVTLSDQLLLDLAVSGSSKPQPTQERAQTDLQRADKRLKIKPDDLDSRLARAVANFRLGKNQKALDDLRVVIGKKPGAVSARQYKVIALARLGKKQDALTELAKFQKEDAPEHSKLCLAAVVAAELGEGADKAFEAMEAAIQKQPNNADLRYDAARAFSLASKTISRSDKAKGRQLAERCLQLLREAIKNDDADFGKMDEDSDLDPIRDDPAFAEIMKAGHSDRRYAAVWSSEANFEAISIYGVDPAAHFSRSRELIAQGYRPVSWSVSQTATEGPLVTASVWHRPVIEEEAKDRLAERQARAAVAMVRLGRAEEVFPLLRHSADPRLRSFIVNWLNPLGAEPKLIVAELDRIDPKAKPTPAPGQQKMDAILFHPETSQRRALILALGTYDTEGLSPDERQPLINKLLALYRNDPDSGIHGAAEWTLRKWGQQKKLKELDAELMKVNDWGERRWYVNGQGQTFAVIEGPVEFLMGSPPTEPNHGYTETLHRRRINRRFALAIKELSVEQYQRFQRLEIDRYSPDPDGPMNGPSWYDAAAYCNWLSEREGLDKAQWCYEPNPKGEYAEGMKVVPDVLERSGYRLPTEAEWEYACRAEAVTSRYYGVSVELLGQYAWYNQNSRDRAWPCGQVKPNDLGLFDMLGNVFEWCLDEYGDYPSAQVTSVNDIINTSSHINTTIRIARGGTFFIQPADVRSADRTGGAPAYRSTYIGFRPSRTYH